MMTKNLKSLLPIYAVENDAILSKMGDMTIGFSVELPALFTLSNEEYEAFHHAWIKAIKVLPVNAVLHKQDWFVESSYQPAFSKLDTSFLSRSSNRFFNERPFLDHTCYVFITRKPLNRKTSTSVFSSLLKRSIVPEETISAKHFAEFLTHVGQLEKILVDSGFVKMIRLGNDALNDAVTRYLNLGDGVIREINFKDGITVGENHCLLYTLADAEFVSALCGSRINYDKFSPNKTKFSVGFAPPGRGNYFRATIFLTSMFLWRMCRKTLRNWKVKGCVCNHYLHIAVKILLPRKQR